MKLIVTPTNLNNLYEIEKLGVSDFIVYIGELSIKNASDFTLDEIRQASEYLKSKNKSLYIAITKILHNRDLKKLDEVLDFLKEIEFQGLIFSDLAVYQTVKEKEMNYNLMYDGDMLGTNSHTVGFADGEKVFLSKEIYYEEIETISKKLNKEVIVHAQGLIGMFHSIRPLVNQYLDYLNVNSNINKEKDYSIYDEERNLYYPIYENEKGSFIMSGKEICLIDEIELLDEIGVSYLKIDGFMQSDEYVLNMTKLYLEALDLFENDIEQYRKNKKNYFESAVSIASRPLDKGFFFKPTLYKVKR